MIGDRCAVGGTWAKALATELDQLQLLFAVDAVHEGGGILAGAAVVEAVAKAGEPLVFGAVDAFALLDDVKAVVGLELADHPQVAPGLLQQVVDHAVVLHEVDEVDPAGTEQSTALREDLGGLQAGVHLAAVGGDHQLLDHLAGVVVEDHFRDHAARTYWVESTDDVSHLPVGCHHHRPLEGGLVGRLQVGDGTHLLGGLLALHHHVVGEALSIRTIFEVDLQPSLSKEHKADFAGRYVVAARQHRHDHAGVEHRATHAIFDEGLVDDAGFVGQPEVAVGLEVGLQLAG